MPHQPTYKIADETYVLPHYIVFPGGRGPLYFNSMLIRGKEPVLIDTGAPRAREQMLDAVWSLVDPKDLRWIYITHDDRDHVGNLNEVLAAAPNATVVMTWLMYAKMMPEFYFPLSRVRIANHGETFHVGDRDLLAFRPPCFDAPTTRGLFDPKTGVYFSGDCFGAPVPNLAEDISEVPEDVFFGNMLAFNMANHTWVQFLEQAQLDRMIGELDALDAKIIASSHAPAARGQTKKLLEVLSQAKSARYEEPTQLQLEQIMQAMAAMAGHAG